MQPINSWKDSSIKPEIIEAEFRAVRSNAEALAASHFKREQDVIKINLSSGFNPKQDTFVRDYTVAAVDERRSQNTNQRRATEAYGVDNLKAKLAETRESLVANRDNLNANKSMAFRPGMNQLALA